MEMLYPAVLEVEIKHKIKVTPRIRPKTPASEGHRQSGPSLGTPRGGGSERLTMGRNSHNVILRAQKRVPKIG